MKKRIALVILLTLVLAASCAFAGGSADECAHKNMRLVKTVESTCTKQGTETYKCMDCNNYTRVRNLPLAEHNWERIKKVEATCIEEGYKKYECTVCEAIKYKTIEKAAHTYGSWNVIEEPTCTREGSRIRYCRVCGRYSTGSIQKLPHPYGSWETVREATDRSMGTEAHSCTACGHRETREFYPAGTLYYKTENLAAVKVLQQYLVDHGLLDSRIDGDYGKRTQEAVKAYQRKLGFEATGIAYPQTLTAIFCTETGKDGQTVMTNNPHVYGDWTVVNEASASAPGLRSHACLYCGYSCESAYNPVGTLYRGMEKCAEVKELQQLLIEKKIIKTIADGEYGKRTEEGVKAFQRMAGLEETGIAYPETIEALRNWQ